MQDTSNMVLSISLPGLEGLSVPLLDPGLGNLEAPVNSRQPCKGCLLKVRAVVVVSYLKQGIQSCASEKTILHGHRMRR